MHQCNKNIQTKKSLSETNPLKQTVQTISNTLIHNINEADYENNMCAHMYISAHAFRRFYLSDRNQILQKILGWLFVLFFYNGKVTDYGSYILLS